MMSQNPITDTSLLAQKVTHTTDGEVSERHRRKERKRERKEKKAAKEKRKRRVTGLSEADQSDVLYSEVNRNPIATPPQSSSPKSSLYEDESQSLPARPLFELEIGNDDTQRESESFEQNHERSPSQDSLIAPVTEQKVDWTEEHKEYSAEEPHIISHSSEEKNKKKKEKKERKEKRREKRERKKKKKEKKEEKEKRKKEKRSKKKDQEEIVDPAFLEEETLLGADKHSTELPVESDERQLGNTLETIPRKKRRRDKSDSNSHSSKKKRRKITPSPDPSLDLGSGSGPSLGDNGFADKIESEIPEDEILVGVIPTKSKDEIDHEVQEDSVLASDMSTESSDEIVHEVEENEIHGVESPTDTSIPDTGNIMFDIYYSDDDDDEDDEDQQDGREITTETNGDSNNEDPVDHEGTASTAREVSDVESEPQVTPPIQKRRRRLPSPSTEKRPAKRSEGNENSQKAHPEKKAKSTKNLITANDNHQSSQRHASDTSDSDSSDIDESITISKKKPSSLFSPAEVDTLLKFRASYCSQHEISSYAFNEKIQGNARTNSSLRRLWDEIQEHVPSHDNSTPKQRRQAVVKACRRMFHNFIRRGRWTEAEDRKLTKLTRRYGNAWARIAPEMERMPEDVRDRWRNHTKALDTKSTSGWTKEEVKALRNAVGDCAAVTFESRRRGEKVRRRPSGAKGGKEGEDNDFESLVNWGVVSDKLGGKRDRMQCVYRWKTLKNNPHFDTEKILARGLKRLRKRNRYEESEEEEGDDPIEEDETVEEDEPGEDDIEDDESADQR